MVEIILPRPPQQDNSELRQLLKNAGIPAPEKKNSKGYRVQYMQWGMHD